MENGYKNVLSNYLSRIIQLCRQVTFQVQLFLINRKCPRLVNVSKSRLENRWRRSKSCGCKCFSWNRSSPFGAKEWLMKQELLRCARPSSSKSFGPWSQIISFFSCRRRAVRSRRRTVRLPGIGCRCSRICRIWTFKSMINGNRFVSNSRILRAKVIVSFHAQLRIRLNFSLKISAFFSTSLCVFFGSWRFVFCFLKYF